MLSVQAILDTIEYISKLYDDEYYYVKPDVINFMNENFKCKNHIGDYFFINDKKVCVSDNHPYPNDCIKIYNNDQYPFYIKILTNDERTIQEIIE